MNQKRSRRLYRKEGLAVRKRGGRKWALEMRAPLGLPSRPNERWSLDFVSGCLTGGRRFHILAIRNVSGVLLASSECGLTRARYCSQCSNLCFTEAHHILLAAAIGWTLRLARKFALTSSWPAPE